MSRSDGPPNNEASSGPFAAQKFTSAAHNAKVDSNTAENLGARNNEITPSKPNALTTEEEKRQKRLERVKQLMRKKKAETAAEVLLNDQTSTCEVPNISSEATTSSSPSTPGSAADSSNNINLPTAATPISSVAVVPVTAIPVTAAPTAGVSPDEATPVIIIPPPPPAPATADDSVAIISNVSVSEAPVEPKINKQQQENADDSLDIFMVGIETEMHQLQFAPRKVKRRRKKHLHDGARAPAVSITLEEILHLQSSEVFPLPQIKETPVIPLIVESLEAEEEVEEDRAATDNENSLLIETPKKKHKVDDEQEIKPLPSSEELDSGLVVTASLPQSHLQPTSAAAVQDIFKIDTDMEEYRYHEEFITELKRKQAEEAAREEIKRRKLEAELEAKIIAAREETMDGRKLNENDDIITNAINSTSIKEKKGEQLEDSDDADYRYAITDDSNLESYFDLVQKCGNKKELPAVDHSQIAYHPFRKNLYIQVREISLMTDHEVDALRKLHGGIRVRGKVCPRPIRSFYQCGLPDSILKAIEKREYEQPFPIQMQALPALMAGRDIIGIAETGSGKTLAYLLPLIRNMIDQPPLRPGEGPMGLVLAPTRELAVQIQREANKFTKIVNLRSIAVYGGTGIGEQLSALKRGAEMVVATPGRLIDVLTINNGKITNLKRVTFCVLDEADRMFDLGFEPQITAITRNIRPDAQTAMFSATFPSHIETMAKKLLRKPIEIIVGSRGQSATRIEQFVEIWNSHREKILRLLKLLGEWCEHGSVIVFVSRQTEADELFAELLKYGYASLVLHGGQDQTDRDFTIQDFKDGSAPILIATSVAARGLDVKSVVLVVNFSAPDHLEDYIHRIGRTGRAGNVGVAYTFLVPEEADKAEDLIKALRQSGKDVPLPLQQLCDTFRVQCNLGLARQWGRGFGGKGFKFTPSERSRQQQDRMRAKQELGLDESDDEEVTTTGLDEYDNSISPSNLFAATVGNLGPGDDVGSASARAKALADIIAIKHGTGRQDIKSVITTSTNSGVTPTNVSYIDTATGNIIEEFDINDYPQTARFKVTHKVSSLKIYHYNKDVLHRIADQSGAVLQVKGRYISPEEKDSLTMLGAKRLYIELIGATPIIIQRAKHELRSLLEAVAMKQLNMPAGLFKQAGRYSVI